MTSVKSVQQQKTKTQLWVTCSKLECQINILSWQSWMVWGKKSTQKRNNYLNPTFFAPRLTEEKERDDEFAQQLDKLLLMLLYVSTHSVGFHALWAIVQNNGVLTFSMLTFSVLTFSMLTFHVDFRRTSDDPKGLSKSDDWRVNAGSVEKQRHLHSAHELWQVLKGIHSSICTCAGFSIFFYLSITHPTQAATSLN